MTHPEPGHSVSHVLFGGQKHAEEVDSGFRGKFPSILPRITGCTLYFFRFSIHVQTYDIPRIRIIVKGTP